VKNWKNHIEEEVLSQGVFDSTNCIWIKRMLVMKSAGIS
jgi:hypothetical protein